MQLWDAARVKNANSGGRRGPKRSSRVVQEKEIFFASSERVEVSRSRQGNWQSRYSSGVQGNWWCYLPPIKTNEKKKWGREGT